MNQTFCFLMYIHLYILQFNWTINYKYVIVQIWVFTSAYIISVTRWHKGSNKFWQSTPQKWCLWMPKSANSNMSFYNLYIWG